MLDGIRIIDFTQTLPGPHTTLRLLDLGAEVIKVESPNGDPARKRDVVFQAQNRGKKSVSVNLKNNSERELIMELIAEADIVIESFRPGVVDKLKVGYEDAKKINPEIIYCSVSGYGQSGEMMNLGSHDINYMALSGILSQLKDDKGKPIHPSLTLADLVGGMAASEAILAAIIQKERTGKGQYLDIALADVMYTLMINNIPIESRAGSKNGLLNLSGSEICYHIYKTKDNRYMSLGAIERKFWINFCTALNKPSWIEHHNSEASNSNLIYLEIKEAFENRTFQEWKEFSLHVDCCMAPVLEINELYDYPYNNDRKLIYKKWGVNHVVTRYNNDNVNDGEMGREPILGEHNIDFLFKR